jgi:hypothetical protein
MTGQPWEGADAQWDAGRYGWRWGSAEELRIWRWQRIGALRERESTLNWGWIICAVVVWMGYMSASWDDYGVSNFLLGLLFVGLISVPFIVGITFIGRALRRLHKQLDADAGQ